MTTFNGYLAALLSVAVLVVTIVLTRTELRASGGRMMPMRPLATLLIMLIAILAPAPVSPFFKGAIVLGLALSLVADAFLLMASTPLIVGVALNLIVYLLYCVAFASRTVLQWPTLWLLLLLLYAAFWYRLLAPSLREIKGDVIAYMVILFLMSWQALEMGLQAGGWWAYVALLGALLLVLADSLRGLIQFRGPVKGGAPVALSVYFVAQWLIAVSVWGGA
jgi:uncharacterized membrane protein YhhN